MKKYRITCQTDAYHASRSAEYDNHEVLKRDGATPVKWVHDDNCGYGYTLAEARKELMCYAYEDSGRSGEKIYHKYLELSYNSDVYTYRIEEF